MHVWETHIRLKKNITAALWEFICVSQKTPFPGISIENSLYKTFVQQHRVWNPSADLTAGDMMSLVELKWYFILGVTHLQQVDTEAGEISLM